MRVTFFDPDTEVLTNQRKGELLEHLARRLADTAGYTELVLRAKHSSLEYDVEGRSKLHGTPLIGEAKAHDAALSGKETAAFIGKIFPLAAGEPIGGLLIATSGFTAEARDYLSSVTDGLERLNIRLRTLVGEEIHQFLQDNSGYAADDALRTQIKQRYGLEMLDAWLVVTERQDFIACSCGPDQIGAPTAYCLFRTDGSGFTLSEDVQDRLAAQVETLRDLELVTDGGTSLLAERVERLPTVAAGVGWFDYKFPTPPDCFVGRESTLATLAEAIEEMRSGGTALRALQVLARSGVGKSSLLLKLQEMIPDALVVTVDGRNLRVASDVRLLVSEAAHATNEALSPDIPLPSSIDEAHKVLEQAGEAVRNADRVLVVQIDQFESALAIPSVFEAVVDLVETSSAKSLPVVWVFGRKSDVAVTFDEGAMIDLRRLNDRSRPVALDDFSPEEGRYLLDRLGDELGQAVRADLAEAISTFAAGFPWLHKRLCAHVISMETAGFSQRDLVLAGLRAEDLFEEDLAGLTEPDRALLKRLAAYLPATASELVRFLEGDIDAGILTEKLNDFLGSRLLRLAGDVYDTYNDVFKTYLLTNRIPFESRYVYRVSPGATIETLRQIAEIGPTTLAKFQGHVGGNQIAVLNKLRELRLLGLIDPQPGHVALTPETQTAIERDALGQLLRERLRANALVTRVLNLVAAEEEASLDAIVEELRLELPHVEIRDPTWQNYARRLASWLHFASLALLEGDTVKRRGVPADESLRGRDFYRGAFAPGTFLPTIRPPRALQVLEVLRDGAADKAAIEAVVGQNDLPATLRDAVALELAEVENGTVRLGRQGRLLIESGRELTERDVAQLALMKPNVKALLDAAADRPLSAAEQREVLASFGSAKWTDGTWGWRLGILRSWLVATGQAKSGRGGLEAS